MIKCPVCGLYEFAERDDYDSCDVCHWQNDDLQHKRPDYWGGANELCLDDFKKQWQNRKAPFEPSPADARELAAVAS